MENEKKRLSVVVSVYNEEKALERFYQETKKVLDSLSWDWELLFVNDGSADGSKEVLERLAGQENRIKVISFSRNFGHESAMIAGIDYSTGDGIVCMDADLQHPPECLIDIVEKMEEGYDIVIGSRFVDSKKDHSLRMIGSRLITAAIRLTTGVMVTDPTSGMRMFNREMIREFALNINYGPEPDTVSYLLKQGAKIAEVPVRIAERAGGESYLKPVVAVRYMARILISILLIQNFRKRRKG